MSQSATRPLPLEQPAAVPWFARLVGAQSTLQAKKAVWGYVFLLPWILGLIIFWIGPILSSFYLSLTEYDVISDPRFIGVANYQQALFKDDLFWSSLGRTFQFSLIVVPTVYNGEIDGAAMRVAMRVVA